MVNLKKMKQKTKVKPGQFVLNPKFVSDAGNSEESAQDSEEDEASIEDNESSIVKGENSSEISESASENEETSSEDSDEHESAPQKNGKRKIDKKSEKQPNKKAKIMKNLHKPLTVEEINELKETEDLYHSNLFRMQIDEVLKEVKLKKKQKNAVNTFLDRLKLFLEKLKEKDLEKLLHDEDYPLKFQPISQDKLENAVYQSPESVSIFGAQALETSISSNLSVDILLTMSGKYLRQQDYSNQIYHHKRALYLFYIFRKLSRKSDFFDEIEIVYLKKDSMKPAIQLKTEEITFTIHAIPKEDFFKLNRFIPKTNNIKIKENSSDESYTATPYYNYNILFDIAIEKNQRFIEESLMEHENVKNAIKLLKIWMRQRQFDEGFYGFGGFFVTMYLIHLIQSHKIYPTMSCYQIIRLFWNQFGNSSLNSKGITLCHQKNLPNQPSIEEFHQYYDLVFIDSTGYCNILSNASQDLYKRIKEESLNALKSLSNKSINSFQLLFMTKIPFCLHFDHVFVVKEDQRLFQKIVEQHGRAEDKVDFLNNLYPHLRKVFMDVLRKGLGIRISSMVPFWSEGNFVVGLQLNPEEALNIVDKGPQANEAEAEDFRKFWGSKAEIRRFKDGSITEAVLWAPANSPVAEKRLICKKIVLYLMKHHFKIQENKICYVAEQFEIVIRQIFSELNETNEEKCLKCIQTFDELGKELRNLSDLPLEITTVLGVDPIFRYCDPSPPLQNAIQNTKGLVYKQYDAKFRAPKVLNGIIQLASSGKWPDDLEAMKRIKAAFYIEIANKMNSRYKESVVQVYSDCIEVLKNNFLYRLKIFHPKEVALTRETLSSTNNLTKLYKNNAESLKLEFSGLIMPKLTSSLHGLYHQYPSFGPTVAIAKRWLYSQLIDPYLFPDEVTELLIADMFLKETPLRPAIQPQTGFFRFLSNLAESNWENEMVVVNFNSEIPEEELEQIETKFQKNRREFPALCLITSCDYKKFSVFTSKAPTAHLLNRVKFLAKCSLDLIVEDYFKLSGNSVKSLFSPSLDGYNLIINLDTKFVRKSTVVSHNYVNFKPIQYEEKPPPPADLDFVKSYLGELREAFDEVAVFFYDPINGGQIAVLWKPVVYQEREFATSHVNACKMINGKLGLNLEAIIKDIEVMGKGLVTDIEKVN